MREKQFMTKIYYAMADMNDPSDPRGNGILVDMVTPLVRHAFNQGWIHNFAFMRFSDGGYHIRFRLIGDEEVLETKVQPYIWKQVTHYRDTHEVGQQQQMELSRFAIHVNQNWNGKRSEFKLFKPGQFQMGIMQGPGEETAHESAVALRGYQDFTTDACLRILQLLESGPDYKTRQTFTRLLLDDFIRLLPLSHRERYYILNFCEQQWLSYFKMEESSIAPYRETYKERTAAYTRYFEQKKGPADSLPYLPESLHPLYMAWVEAFPAFTSSIVRRDENGYMTQFDALRILALFHLTHNRIGIGLVPEIQWAHMLKNYYGRFLTTQEIEESHLMADRLIQTYTGETAVSQEG